ncbi:hypothetical protein U5F73_20710 [Stenotrophomonas pavanii]|uniref:hypothetical protein n=1 Tax=Stenotrophomonas maltophilia group TaxID=995085 RepID=UPI0012B43017|nr:MULTISPECIES: hypothetical protein [Stenotrophomonas]MDZ7477382.1 hypothetical protein [Stenotrophomonas pavanii]
MANKDRERIFRAAIASLISSNLSGRDLQRLVKYLDEDSSFRYRFFDLLMEVYKSGQYDGDAEVHFESPWEEVSPPAPNSDGLVDLVLEALSRKRLPKRELKALLAKINPSFGVIESDDMTSRELINYFLSISSTSARKSLLRSIGLDVEDDLYLGGIADRRRD